MSPSSARPRQAEAVARAHGVDSVLEPIACVDADPPIQCALAFDGSVLGNLARLEVRINARGPVTDAGARVMAECLADRLRARWSRT